MDDFIYYLLHTHIHYTTSADWLSMLLVSRQFNRIWSKRYPVCRNVESLASYIHEYVHPVACECFFKDDSRRIFEHCQTCDTVLSNIGPSSKIRQDFIVAFATSDDFLTIPKLLMGPISLSLDKNITLRDANSRWRVTDWLSAENTLGSLCRDTVDKWTLSPELLLHLEYVYTFGSAWIYEYTFGKDVVVDVQLPGTDALFPVAVASSEGLFEEIRTALDGFRCDCLPLSNKECTGYKDWGPSRRKVAPLYRKNGDLVASKTFFHAIPLPEPRYDPFFNIYSFEYDDGDEGRLWFY